MWVGCELVVQIMQINVIWKAFPRERTFQQSKLTIFLQHIDLGSDISCRRSGLIKQLLSSIVPWWGIWMLQKRLTWTFSWPLKQSQHRLEGISPVSSCISLCFLQLGPRVSTFLSIWHRKFSMGALVHLLLSPHQYWTNVLLSLADLSSG